MATKKKTAKSKMTASKASKISKRVSVFARTAHKSQEWIREMQKELKWISGDSAYHLLRAVLQSLRDQMSIHESAHFAAQLPILLRGTFYEGWNPQVAELSGSTKDEFLKSVKHRMGPVGAPKFELESGVLVALNVIKKHISAGEMKDLSGMINPSLKNFIEKNTQQEASL